MSEIFLTVMNMGISASWIVLAVVLLRLLLKKAPKWIHVLLWGIVAVRLICPFSLESVLSLIPSSETIPMNIASAPQPNIDSGIPVLNAKVNDYLARQYSGGAAVDSGSILTALCIIWLAGMGVMLLYTLISCLRIKHKVKEAVAAEGNIWLCDRIAAPFILGICRPKIYLPFSLSKQAGEYVVAHERAHIRRKDHLWKPLGFLLLTLHWLNPLMWLGYVLLCRDIELACDEKVIRQLEPPERADYSQVLLSCSVSRRMIAACPLAFGEVGVKKRVKTVLNYKKPAFWIILVSVLAVAVTAVCLLTNPSGQSLKNIESFDLMSYCKNLVSITKVYGEPKTPTEIVTADGGHISLEYAYRGKDFEDMATFDKNVLIQLLSLRIAKEPVSETPEEKRDESNYLILRRGFAPDPQSSPYLIYVYFNEDFSEVFVKANSESATRSYQVLNPKKAARLFTGLHSTSNGTDEMEDFKISFPTSFGMSADKGMEVCVYEFAEGSYSYSLIPKGIADTDLKRGLLHGDKLLSLQGIHKLVEYYYPQNAKDHVTILLCDHVLSSDGRVGVDLEAHLTEVTEMFWKNYPAGGEEPGNRIDLDTSSLPAMVIS